ncbi:MAG: peptidylprolyl isomerase [Clostridia bacterium]|nr:peptidylprolyl isomerase [Clostridia bacterium]
MKKRIISLFALVLALSMALCGCGGKTIETEESKDLDSSIIATVEGQKISQADYNFIYSLVYNNMSQYSMYYGADWENMEIEEGKTIAEFMEENALDQVKQMAMVVELAKEKGITVKDIKEDVEKQKKEVIESYQGEDKYKEFLVASHTTDKAIDRYLEISAIYAKYYENLTAKGGELKVDTKELEKQFLEDYKGKWRAQHILVSTQAQQDAEGKEVPGKTDEEAKKIALEVIEKLNAGEDFDALIEQYNEDPGLTKGNYYIFGTGEMVEPFEKATDALKIGEYTKEPVKTDFGYHIIKRYEINTEIPEFAQFKESKLQEKAMELITKKVKDAKVKVEKKELEAYMKKWAKERAAEAKKAEEEAKKAQEEAQKNAEAEPAGDAKTEEKAEEKKAE